MPPASIVPIEHVLTEHRFSLLAGGGYFALGAGGAITGRGANLLLIDDPTKSAADANSDAYRRSLHEWFESTAYTRLQGGSVLSLPAVAETDEGWRQEGEALWPKRQLLRELLSAQTRSTIKDQ
jgi:hypothetical protein